MVYKYNDIIYMYGDSIKRVVVMRRSISIVISLFIFIYCVFGNGVFDKYPQEAKAITSTTVEVIAPSQIYMSQLFHVTIKLNEVTDLYGFSLDLLYDPKIIEIQGVDKGSIFSSSTNANAEFVNKIDTIRGVLTYCRTFTEGGNGVSGSGSLLTIHCKAVGEGIFKWNNTFNPKEALSLQGKTSRILLLDSNVNYISHSTQNIQREIVKDIKPPTTQVRTKGGLYNKSQTVAISAIDDYAKNPSIYYTLDGTVPTAENSKYDGNIFIDKDTILKFIAIDDMNNISPVFTENYYIDTVAPFVKEASPKNNEGLVDINKIINFKFNESIKEGVDFAKIQLRAGNGNLVEIKTSINEDNVQIQPLKELSYGTNYSIVIPKEAIKDNAENSILAEITSIFRTSYATEDLNKDSVIDIKDLATIAQKYNTFSTNSGWIKEYDLVPDNVIDIYDIVIISRRF